MSDPFTPSPTSSNSSRPLQTCLQTANSCSTANLSNHPPRLQTSSWTSPLHSNSPLPLEALPPHNRHQQQPRWSHKSHRRPVPRLPPRPGLPLRPRRSRTDLGAPKTDAKHLLSLSSETVVFAKSASVGNTACWNHTTAKVSKTLDVRTRTGMPRSWRESVPSCFVGYKTRTDRNPLIPRRDLMTGQSRDLFLWSLPFCFNTASASTVCSTGR